jgi:rhodanese-related sulfurtransferase
MPSDTISLSDFKAVREQPGELTILDVRTPAEFARVHVPGAALLPLDELDPAKIAAAHAGSTDAIYIICQSGVRAGKAVQRIRAAGLQNAWSIEGGTAAWEKAGLPVERGHMKSISLERQVRIGAGSLALLGALLAWWVHPAFIALSGFVGAGLLFAGITDYCGMGLLLAKMPWNR